MTINLITFASILHKQATVRSSHEAILSELEKYFTVNLLITGTSASCQKMNSASFSLLPEG